MPIIIVSDSRKNRLNGAFIRVIPYVKRNEKPYTIFTNPEGESWIDDRARTYIIVVTYGKRRAVTTIANPQGEIRITI
jgi:hypothetical protein